MRIAKQPIEKPMPHNVAAERAVLGALLVEPTCAAGVFEQLDPLDFYFPHHEAMFRLLRTMTASGTPIDIVTVGEQVMLRGADVFGGSSWTELPEHCVSPANVDAYVQVVKVASIRRQMLSVLHESLDVVQTSDAETVQDLGSTVLDRLLKIVNQSRRRMTWTAYETWRLVEDAAEAHFNGTIEHRQERVFSTGNQHLDRALRGGLRGGDLCVIGGAPGHGKSALAMGMFIGAAIAGRRAVYISAEPNPHEFGERLISAASGVKHPLVSPSASRLRSDKDWDKIVRFEAELGPALRTCPFVHQPRVTVEQVRMHVTTAALTGPVDLVIVDHLHLMDHGKDRAERLDQAIGRTTSALKALAGELDCAVVALAQLNRSARSAETAKARGRTNDGDWWDKAPLPELSDLREAGSIEQDADIVLFPVRAEVAMPGDLPVPTVSPTRAVVKVAKQRNGPKARVPMFWDGECIAYREAPDYWFNTKEANNE